MSEGRLVPKPTTWVGAVIELVAIVAVAIGVAFTVQALLVKPFEIPTASMEPALVPGERVLVDRLSYRFGDPSPGDIVVFHPPASVDDDYRGPVCAVETGKAPCAEAIEEQSDDNFIKRIVAGPGDTLSVQDGHPVVNGKIMEEDFIRPCGGGEICNLPEEIEIPAGHYFMMGDNRGASEDSRYWGPVPDDWIIGKAFFTYWPVDEIGPF